MNVKLFNLMPGVNKTRFLVQHEYVIQVYVIQATMES